MGRLIFIKTGDIGKDIEQLKAINRHYKEMYMVTMWSIIIAIIVSLIIFLFCK